MQRSTCLGVTICMLSCLLNQPPIKLECSASLVSSFPLGTGPVWDFTWNTLKVSIQQWHSYALSKENKNTHQQRHMYVMYSSVQSLSRVQLFVTPWIAAHQASLSITNSRSSLKLMSIKSVMPSSHLILCRPLLLLPPIPPSIRVFSNESTLRMRWPKYWSFSFSIIPSKEHPELISFRMYSLDL